MKFRTLLAATLCLSVLSCDKKYTDDVSNADNIKNNSSPNNFEISVPERVDMTADGSTKLNIQVKQLSSAGNKVTLSLEDVPDEFSYELSTTEDTPPYTSALTLTGNYPDTGEHTITIVAINSANIEKTATCTLNVRGSAYCATRMAGSFTGSNGQETEITTDHTVKDGILIGNGHQLKATLNCADRSIAIDFKKEMSGGYMEYKGSGTFTPPNSLTVNYTETVTQFNPVPPYQPYVYESDYSYTYTRK